jgi:hypothetical protein
MCLIDSSDGQVTMLDAGRYVVARRAHKCAECWRRIDAGERYYRETFVFEGDLSHHKTCEHCMVVRQWLQDECGGWLFGSVQEDAADHASGYGVDLARAVIGMRWKWRGRSGRLLRVPGPIPTWSELRGRGFA